MGEAKTTIELNGKNYDARTGRLLGAVHAMPPLTKPTNGANVDGFIRQYSTAEPASHATKSARQHQPTFAKRKPERAKTLMRHVVKRPSIGFKSQNATAQPANKTTLVGRSSPELQGRITRATQIAKSPLVQRFSWSANNSSVTKKVAPISVRKPATAHHVSALSTPVNESETPALPLPPALSKRDPFTDALRKADTYRRPTLHAKKRVHHRVAKKLGVTPRMVNVGAASLATLLLTGFVAYQNAPNFAVRIASSKAGFAARMPSYQPSGFAMNGPIESSPGAITIRFRSNSDNRAFTITQRPTNWNSETLKDNFVAVDEHKYQTYQDKGKTVFVYDGSTATWVNGGVWYQVEGDSSLNNDQLLHIARSL